MKAKRSAEGTRIQKMKDNIWSILVNEMDESLILDCRNEAGKKVELWKMDLKSMKTKKLSIEITWWERLTGIKKQKLFVVAYEDRQDPTRHSFHEVDLKSKSRTSVDSLPAFDNATIEAALYEMETENHQLVSQFLGLSLPLSCEYLELDNYIIISYYLRSENGFDRFLLLLRDGEKVWKVAQDHSMRGFSPGSFFVYHQHLIFVKDRNEVCIHPL